MNKEYNLIRYEIDTTYNEYNELFIDRLLYEMDVEGLLFELFVILIVEIMIHFYYIINKYKSNFTFK